MSAGHKGKNFKAISRCLWNSFTCGGVVGTEECFGKDEAGGMANIEREERPSKDHLRVSTTHYSTRPKRRERTGILHESLRNDLILDPTLCQIRISTSDWK